MDSCRLRGHYLGVLGVSLVGLTGGACGPSAHELELRQLTETVRSLQAQVARQDQRAEATSNDLIMLAHRLDQLAASTPATEAEPDEVRAPPLAVVRLSPEAPPPALDEDDGGPPIMLTLRGDEAGTAVVPSGASPPDRSPASIDSTDADGLFRQALDAFRGGETDSAHGLFAAFVGRFPRHDLADNARYWMGECRYERSRYQEAVREFERVVKDFPKSKKVPDSLLKIGLAYERLNERARARGSFKQLISAYPHSALAELARARLARGK